MENPETSVTLETEKTKGTIRNGESRDIRNKVQRKPKGQSGMENPETSEIKFRENQRDNQEWRIQRHQK